MVRKSYDWDGGAVLDDHTRKKHKILSEYFSEYLRIRCAVPRREKFRLAVVDGFSGAGLYKNGEYGSPIIFIDTLKRSIKEINLSRAEQGHKLVSIECFIIFNDCELGAITKLRENLAPFLAEIKENERYLKIECEFLNENFESAYKQIKGLIKNYKFNNVFFNLDQYGYSHVTMPVIQDITNTWKSAEVLLTFMIQSLLTYLSPNKNLNSVKLEPEVKEKIEHILEGGPLHKREWLGEAEKITFNYLKGCANYVSPFSINNPGGWQYWLMHFATSHRARQAYNDILHKYGEAQAHYGRAGLNMLSYNPADHHASLYLFNSDSRTESIDALKEDIPRLISQSGESLEVKRFYANAYNETPAHSEDIHQAIIESPELTVYTESGGERRKPNTIKVTDTIVRKPQLIFTFPPTMK